MTYEDDDDHRLVRPYFLTQGRTQAQLAIETMVQTVASGSARALAPEQAQIAELCAQPRAIAEVAALLKLPLGVARVLVSDMVASGALQAAAVAAASSPVDVIDALIAGVEQIAATA